MSERNSTASNLRGRAGGALGGFKTFLLRGNVVDLAVGIVIGAAFGTVVKALVTDLITPLIPTGSNTGLAELSYTLPFTGSKLLIGDFLNNVLSFLIIAFVVYFFVVLPVNSLMSRYKKPEEPVVVTTRDCPSCLSSVPLKATRCAFCTSVLPAVEESATA